MMRMRGMLGIVLSGVMAAGAMAQTTQQAASETKTPLAAASDDTSGASVTDAQLCTMTVHEAWVASGRNEDRFFDLVKRAAEMSATKRGVTLPDDQTAGTRFGNLIKTNGRRDPDQLLYAVVDYAVRKTAGITATAKK